MKKSKFSLLYRCTFVAACIAVVEPVILSSTVFALPTINGKKPLSIEGKKMRNLNLNADGIKEINDLIQYEIDIYHMLMQTSEKVENQNLQKDLTNYMLASEELAKSLSNFVLENGGTPPDFTKDFGGFLMQGYTSIRGITGDLGILKAIQTNHNFSMEAYKKYLKSRNQTVESLGNLNNAYLTKQKFSDYLRTHIEKGK